MGSVHRCKNRAVARADGGGLPTDVLFEVLLHFPADELFRLRLVCRTWRSLTSDPIFAKAHAARHPLVVAGIKIARRKYEVRVVDLSGNIVKRMPLVQPSRTLSTQQDMVCLTGKRKRDQSPGCVLDLAAGKAVTALRLRDHKRFGDVISPFLLGHVASTGEYKVFYSHYLAPAVHGVEGVYALPVCYITTVGDGGRWRVTPRPPGHITSSQRERVAVGGVAYILLDVLWPGSSSNVEPDNIAVFDLATEVWRPATLQGPLSSRLASDGEKLVYHQYKMQLTTMDGCLVFVYLDDHQDTSIMDIWFLMDMGVDKGLWNKRYSIRSTTNWYGLRNSCPLLLLDDGRIVIWEHRPCQIQVVRVYDPRTDKWADLATLEKPYFSMNMYQGNLLCPGL